MRRGDFDYFHVEAPCGAGDHRARHVGDDDTAFFERLGWNAVVQPVRLPLQGEFALRKFSLGDRLVSFTAGVGENAAAVRLDALKGVEGLGIEVDEQRNSQSAKGARRISTDSSPIAVLVVPTNEELAIARDCLRAI